MNKRDHTSAFVDENERDTGERPTKRPKVSSFSPIDLLPPELVTKIAGRCDEASAMSFLCSCKAFRSDRKMYYAPEVVRDTKCYTGPLNKFAKACAIEGHLNILKWMYGDDDTRPTVKTYTFPCYDGLTEERELTTAWGDFLKGLGFFALENGRLEVFKWLRSKGCPWTDMFPVHAAIGGHLPVLEWLRSEECPWNTWAAAFAAKKGHLEILKWMRSVGCSWDQWTPG